MNKLLLSIVPLITLGCSSSETVVVEAPSLTDQEINLVFGTDDADTNSSELPFDPLGSIDIPVGGFDSIPVRELVGDFSYEPFNERDGIFITFLYNEIMYWCYVSNCKYDVF